MVVGVRVVQNGGGSSGGDVRAPASLGCMARALRRAIQAGAVLFFDERGSLNVNLAVLVCGEAAFLGTTGCMRQGVHANVLSHLLSAKR